MRALELEARFGVGPELARHCEAHGATPRFVTSNGRKGDERVTLWSADGAVDPLYEERVIEMGFGVLVFEQDEDENYWNALLAGLFGLDILEGN
jgi:hypothetical protein